MHRAITLLGVLLLAGCGGVRLTDEVRQESANSLATAIEAADGMRMGGPPEACASAVISNCNAVLRCLEVEPWVPLSRRPLPPPAVHPEGSEP